ncbi:MAG TPA: hypothetical protein VFI29_03990 [Hanamia sp.]|nr:hypothetical protein [Hanamia sp.]
MPDIDFKRDDAHVKHRPHDEKRNDKNNLWETIPDNKNHDYFD